VKLANLKLKNAAATPRFFMHGCFASHSMVIAVGVHPGIMACLCERRERGPNRARRGVI